MLGSIVGELQAIAQVHKGKNDIISTLETHKQDLKIRKLQLPPADTTTNLNNANRLLSLSFIAMLSDCADMSDFQQQKLSPSPLRIFLQLFKA